MNIFVNSLTDIGDVVLPILQQQLLYSSILFVVVLLFSLALRKKSPFIHLALWSLILIRLILPPDVAHPLSLRNLSAGFFHSDKAETTASSLHDPYKPLGAPTKAPDALEHSFSISWQEIALMMWIVGALVFLNLFFSRRRRWTRLLKSASPIHDPFLISVVNEWRYRFGIKRQVQLKISTKTQTPFTMGLWRPVIVLPKSTSLRANGESEAISSEREISSAGDRYVPPAVGTRDDVLEHLEAIIAHEMAHIKRLDDVWILTQNIIQAIYFFHPAVWLTNHNIYIARECICDSMVLAHSTLSKRVYGQGLITSLKFSFWGLEGAGVLAAFSSPQKIIKTRITNIKKGYRMKTPIILKIVFVVMAIVILPMASQSKNAADRATDRVIQAENPISFVNPLQPGIYKLTASYGEQKHPITGEMRFHRAVDLAAKTGTPVYAAADGIIIKAVAEYESGKGMGKYIEIQHQNGFTTRYTQLDQISANQGDNVAQGEEIGQVGSTGLSTGPHLHFEIWQDGAHVNPADYIKF